MKQHLLILLLSICQVSLIAQSRAASTQSSHPDTSAYSTFEGRYELEGGMLIQVAFLNGSLAVVVPGAPIQKLQYHSGSTFHTVQGFDARYTFSGKEGSINLIYEDKEKTLTGKKIANAGKIWSITMDSLLLLTKSTPHFVFLYTETDAPVIDSLALQFETTYTRVLADFKLNSIPNVTVRIYPDLKSFHKGINFPDAPDEVLATAFGMDDLRTVSLINAGPAAWMLQYLASHEFTHVVHLNIDYSPNNPRWLWEGVAQYEAKWFFDPNEFDFMKKREFPRLSALTNGMEYMMGFTVIEAIKDLWGFDTVISLIKNQGNVQKTLKMDQQAFEKMVFERIYEKYVRK